MSQIKSASLIVLAALLSLAGCGSDKEVEYSAAQEKAIVDRIAPVGEVAMEGDPIASAPAVAAASGPRSGEEIYKKACFVCHTPGVAGAPKIGDAAAWEPRIAQGMDTLYEHAWKGFKTMPAKGNCFDCTEEEMKAAVDYMIKGAE